MGTSAYDIVNRALRINGVIASLDSGDAQDVNDAFTSLNMMIEAWSLEDLMCYYIKSSTFPTVIGTASYTIGVGGTCDTERPISIQSAFLRDMVDNSDSPIGLLTDIDYQAIPYKGQAGRPESIYYQPVQSLGILNLYPVPDAVYTISIAQLCQLTKFSELRHELDMPPGYLKALIWNLAIEIAPEYGKAVDEVTANKAVEARMLIKRKNNIIPALCYDEVLLSSESNRDGSFIITRGF
jgi:hypothetical protein